MKGDKRRKNDITAAKLTLPPVKSKQSQNKTDTSAEQRRFDANILYLHESVCVCAGVLMPYDVAAEYSFFFFFFGLCEFE